MVKRNHERIQKVDDGDWTQSSGGLSVANPIGPISIKATEPARIVSKMLTGQKSQKRPANDGTRQPETNSAFSCFVEDGVVKTKRKAKMVDQVEVGKAAIFSCTRGLTMNTGGKLCTKSNNNKCRPGQLGPDLATITQNKRCRISQV